MLDRLYAVTYNYVLVNWKGKQMATTAHGLEEIVAEQEETIRELRAELASAEKMTSVYLNRLHAKRPDDIEIINAGSLIISRLHQVQRAMSPHD